MGGTQLVPTISYRHCHLEKQKKELKVVSFLASFGPHYASGKNQILTNPELPTLNVAFSRFSRVPIEELAADHEETAALAATT